MSGRNHHLQKFSVFALPEAVFLPAETTRVVPVSTLAGGCVIGSAAAAAPVCLIHGVVPVKRATCWHGEVELHYHESQLHQKLLNYSPTTWICAVCPSTYHPSFLCDHHEARFQC